jgi:hypothetical protein
MWRCVDLALTDVSEERIASIFRVEESASREPAWAVGCSEVSANQMSDYVILWNANRYHM